MTRKRFIKLLMSRGLQRNEAQKKAEEYNSKNVSYSDAYMHFCVSVSFANLAKSFNNVGECIRKATAGLAKLGKALKEINERGAENGST